jgi:hypothetical protein
MAKQMEDFSAAPVKKSEIAPTPKIGLLIRYLAGRKEEAVQEAFDRFGGIKGLVSTVGSCGQSRSWSTPEEFPYNNLYVPGLEHQSMLFVKYELID